MIVLVMGVAGSGKSTVGAALAARLGWKFVEGDALHPPENVARMARGEPLTDRDRAPWLAALRRVMEADLSSGASAVVVASGLKAAYRRELLVDDPRVVPVFLDISPRLATERLAARGGHFFGPELVASQFAALERPPAEMTLPGSLPVPELVDRIRRRVAGAGAWGSSD